MPFSLKNAAATFQPAIYIIFSGVRGQVLTIYLDDVVVFSKTVAEQIRHLDTVFTLLRNTGTSLKLKSARSSSSGSVISVTSLNPVASGSLKFHGSDSNVRLSSNANPATILFGGLHRLPALREVFLKDRSTTYG